MFVVEIFIWGQEDNHNGSEVYLISTAVRKLKRGQFKCCKEACVRNLCVVTMVTETKCLTSKKCGSEQTHTLREALAPLAVKQQVWGHMNEPQTLQSHSDAARTGT